MFFNVHDACQLFGLLGYIVSYVLLNPLFGPMIKSHFKILIHKKLIFTSGNNFFIFTSFLKRYKEREL
ncbi:hypothetical protein EJD97_013176 [Solanum chilense]|uniref:Uncharacterized protein n=1 Tax=Solanum chilense TaxID=4083 RepID=A0A6N2AEU4_SOLCI|nr:hypothetical protein EJD97_013176 [Solanum chilense]